VKSKREVQKESPKGKKNLRAGCERMRLLNQRLRGGGAPTSRAVGIAIRWRRSARSVFAEWTSSARTTLGGVGADALISYGTGKVRMMALGSHGRPSEPERLQRDIHVYTDSMTQKWPHSGGAVRIPFYVRHSHYWTRSVATEASYAMQRTHFVNLTSWRCPPETTKCSSEINVASSSKNRGTSRRALL
jgi:hypothetical protein